MKTWITRHLQTAIGSLGRLAQQPGSTLLTVLVMGIALALPASLNVLVTNAQLVSGNWDRALDITVYFKQSVDETTAKHLVDTLRQRKDVKAVQFISAGDALKDFKEHSGFSSALEALTSNPLPQVAVITPAATDNMGSVIDSLSVELRTLPDVDVVQVDTAWVQRYLAILDAFHRVLGLIAVLLGFGVIVIIGNTIRLDIQNRREEIEVTKLVGGSDAFVRRPFLYSGFWYGLGGGVAAWLLVAIVVALLSGPVQRIAGLYNSDFALSGLSLDQSLGLLAAGIGLGWAGSLVATNRHLNEIVPK
ncbi:MAG: permease-like cell division protein FtsX [Steroidobacter sp.]